MKLFKRSVALLLVSLIVLMADVAVFAGEDTTRDNNACPLKNVVHREGGVPALAGGTPCDCIGCVHKVPVRSNTPGKSSGNLRKISTAYISPVLPGTSKWSSMTMDECMAITYVSSFIAEQMTTEALVSTVLHYPFIINIFAYASLSEGVNAVKGYYPPLVELMERRDASKVLSSFIVRYESKGQTNEIHCIAARAVKRYIDFNNGYAPRFEVDPLPVCLFFTSEHLVGARSTVIRI